MKFPEIGADYLITLDTIDGNDEMIIEVEVTKGWFNGDITRLDKLTKLLTAQIRDEVLVKPIIKLVEPNSLPKPEGKAVRVKELRKALNS